MPALSLPHIENAITAVRTAIRDLQRKVEREANVPSDVNKYNAQFTKLNEEMRILNNCKASLEALK